MIAVTNQATVRVDIQPSDEGYQWSYSKWNEETWPENAKLGPHGSVTVPANDGPWEVIYKIDSSDYQLFSALINTNPAAATRLSDFDQILGLQFDAGNIDGSSTISTASIFFANTLPVTNPHPVGISFELWARLTQTRQVITSSDPQVKNEM
ncbi:MULTISPECIES: hypothetical protein [unclassified Azospirillum]|uniref:hypothetical protein n=1 Tax=unclassified Azospirillum TaxID=2630922 RepID=UPI000B634768|nr:MULTISPECIES: hypothetical protein [unclassified Azospirillum]SNS70794.1 hypothetical protein SAMN05880556_11031 [Azospirillum sp. RU38E]SNS89022.1 hypothetical protein SAMN05880591_11031 [Azospirillum sp. RU37A]